MANCLHDAVGNLGNILLGKEYQIRLALACIVARGHLLLDDLPGVGKTTLAEALARCFGLEFRRIHFTSDLLPADITGLNVLDSTLGQFRFQRGPIFTQVLLADEINRASPRTQSALLEAMANGRVSVDGISHELPEPFVVIASQNGLEQSGTYPLPESQLDRFLMRLSLGFPDRQAESDLLEGKQSLLSALDSFLSPAQLFHAQKVASQLPATKPLIAYVLDLLAASRLNSSSYPPLSPRAGLALMAAARSWAYLESATYVTPEHVQAVFPAVAQHRFDSGRSRSNSSEHIAALLAQVDAIR